MRLFAHVRVVNVGCQAVHVRLDKVQQSIVKFLSFTNLRTSSIPPGLDADGVIELEVPTDL